MPSEWALVVGAGAVSITIRLLPEIWLRGKEPPGPLARSLPWLPVCVAGALVGLLHAGAPAGEHLAYLVAGVVAALTLLVRRSFYLPLVAGAATLALLRHFMP